MKGSGQGALFGGRYALQRRLMQGPDLERWSAHDTTLEREVALTIIDSDHPNRAGVLDAARRAAGVEDSRLTRILDVGSQDGNSFIVEEAMSGSESLATILLDGPLPPEDARRVVGETAKGLETAGQRGLHHLRLTPHHVMIAPDGAVRLSGVAVAAAIDGPDEQDLDAATSSRRDAQSLVAMLYAALTGRWPLEENLPGLAPAPRFGDGAVAPSEIAAGVPGDLDALCRTTLNEASGPLTPGDVASRIAPWSRDRVHRAGGDPTVVLPLPTPGDATARIPVRQDATVPTPAGATQRLPIQPQPDRSPSGGGFDAGSPGSLASSSIAADSTRVLSVADHGREPISLPSGLSGQFDDVERPLPLLPASTTLPPSRGQSTLVVLVVFLLVALALFFGYRGLRGPSSVANLSQPTPGPTARASAPPVSQAPPTRRPTTAPPKDGPILIQSATGFDPDGDEAENNGRAERVFDGDLGTFWSSEKYSTPDFGNLKKGAGVILDLGEPASVRQAALNLRGGPVDVTVYAATDPDLQDAVVIGEASGASGPAELKTDEVVPKAQYVIVWFTSLAPDDGLYSASISEIALS